MCGLEASFLGVGALARPHHSNISQATSDLFWSENAFCTYFVDIRVIWAALAVEAGEGAELSGSVLSSERGANALPGPAVTAEASGDEGTDGGPTASGIGTELM
jgi:hypothetical protein